MFQIDIYIETSSAGGKVKHGAWAYLFDYTLKTGKKYTSITAGCEQETTGKRLVLQALVASLLQLKKNCIITVICTDDYLLSGMNHLNQWKKAGWKTAKGDVVKNADLWQQMDTLRGGQIISFDKRFNTRKYDMVDAMKRKMEE